MKSGLFLSSIITIWIVATIVAVNMLLPDIKATIEMSQTIGGDSRIYIDSGDLQSATTANDLITTYTPLSVLDKLGL